MSENDDIKTTWISSYSLKFEGCRNWQPGGGEDGANTNHPHVQYRLCPKGEGRNCTSGCQDGNSFVVGMNQFIETYVKEREEACRPAIDKCGCDGEKEKQKCLTKCLRETRHSHCIPNKQGIAPETFSKCTRVKTKDGKIRNRRKNNNQWEENQEEEKEEHDNNGNDLFVGPYCSGDGIYLRAFLDKACTRIAKKGAYEKLNKGARLPYSNEPLVGEECMDCNPRDKQKERLLEDGFAPTCSGLYDFSEKWTGYFLEGIGEPVGETPATPCGNRGGCNDSETSEDPETEDPETEDHEPEEPEESEESERGSSGTEPEDPETEMETEESEGPEDPACRGSDCDDPGPDDPETPEDPEPDPDPEEPEGPEDPSCRGDCPEQPEPEEPEEPEEPPVTPPEPEEPEEPEEPPETPPEPEEPAEPAEPVPVHPAPVPIGPGNPVPPAPVDPTPPAPVDPAPPDVPIPPAPVDPTPPAPVDPTPPAPVDPAPEPGGDTPPENGDLFPGEEAVTPPGSSSPGGDADGGRALESWQVERSQPGSVGYASGAFVLVVGVVLVALMTRRIYARGNNNGSKKSKKQGLPCDGGTENCYGERELEDGLVVTAGTMTA